MPKRPNIIFLLSDDQGAWAMGCAGNPDVRTPNLNRLAREGLRFDNFFCASPVCSPARASILTGTIPSVHGVQDWLRGGNVDAGLPEAKDSPLFRDEHAPIRYLDGLTCYTDLLAQAGYACALSGKWHLGDSLTPQHGFSRWFTIARGGCGYYQPDVVRNGKLGFETRYITDLITDDAVDNIRALAGREEPFYLSVHYTAPHSPWDRANHPPEVWARYEDCAFTATPDEPLHPWQVGTAPFGTGERRRELLRGYYTAITAMDTGIGRVLDALAESGAAEDTLIIFSGDNGMNMGHHGIWGKGNGTFPLNLYDTSVKVPFIVSGPGVPRGKVSDALCGHCDLLPTLREYLSLPGEVVQPLPGRSFADILEGEPSQGRESVVVYDEYGPARMIRTRTHKYIHRYPYGPNEFYDLARDPDEKNNLIDAPEEQPRIETLRGRLEEWFARWADPKMDGARCGATGSGQLRRPGVYAEGKQAFADPPNAAGNL